MAASEPLAAKLADVVGHNRIAINMVWTLFCGFLVMFMQAGFAMAETGFTRAKNAGHTMAMNFMVYAIGMLGYWIVRLRAQMGGVGGAATLGGGGVLDSEFTINLFGKDFGLFGTKGFFLSGVSLRRGRSSPSSSSRWSSWTPRPRSRPAPWPSAGPSSPS